jgi:hypothetical protein
VPGTGGRRVWGHGMLVVKRNGPGRQRASIIYVGQEVHVEADVFEWNMFKDPNHSSIGVFTVVYGCHSYSVKLIVFPIQESYKYYTADFGYVALLMVDKDQLAQWDRSLNLGCSSAPCYKVRYLPVVKASTQ